jgi:hypothetical protein
MEGADQSGHQYHSNHASFRRDSDDEAGPLFIAEKDAESDAEHDDQWTAFLKQNIPSKSQSQSNVFFQFTPHVSSNNFPPEIVLATPDFLKGSHRSPLVSKVSLLVSYFISMHTRIL